MICSNCGTEVTGERLCDNCGKLVDDGNAQPQRIDQPQRLIKQQSSNQMNQMHVPYNDVPGSFAERLHSFGRSKLFLAGVILFSIGNLVSVSVSMGSLSISSVPLPQAVLSIIGFWMIFAASKKPKLPEKTKAALVLLKISAILTMITNLIVASVALTCAIVLFAAPRFIALNSIGYYSDFMGEIFAYIGIALLIAAGFLAKIAVTYYKNSMSLFNGIQSGIADDAAKPLPGVKPLTVITSIFAGFVVLRTAFSICMTLVLRSMVTSGLRFSYNDIPWEYERIIRAFYGTTITTSFILTAAFSLATRIGIILVIMTLNRFNNTLFALRLETPKER